MKFNKVIRGAKREMNDIENIYAILDAGFLCHIAFQHQGQTMMIPTAYGRFGDYLYMHGSTKNFMLNQILDGQTICITVTHLDGIVLAKSLFYSSVTYRSAILFGKAVLIDDDQEKIHGMKIISENLVKGRTDEVEIGTESQLDATMVIKFTIESASAKMRSEGPMGDDDILDKVWSGVIPLTIKALETIQDQKFGTTLDMSKSVKQYYEKNR